MIKILFICHGNICRSPMAEFLMRDIVKKAGMDDRFVIASAAVSAEELGNPVHPGTKDKLKQYGISTVGKTAVQMKKEDYEKYDYLIGMDGSNIRGMLRILGKDPEGKVHKLPEFAGSPGDIADPWYTGDFDKTYDDVKAGCTGLFHYLTEADNG